MNATPRPLDVFCAALSLILCFACGSARAGEPRTPVSKSPTQAFACMTAVGNVEYDSAAFVTKNPGPTYEDHSKHVVAIQHAYEAYLKQRYGYGGYVTCGRWDTLAEAKKWLQWRKEEQVGRNYQLVITDWTYSGTVSAAAAPTPPPAEGAEQWIFCRLGVRTGTTLRSSEVEMTIYTSIMPMGQRLQTDYNLAFAEYVSKTYGIELPPRAQCIIGNNEAETRKALESRTSSDYVNHTIVATGWTY